MKLSSDGPVCSFEFSGASLDQLFWLLESNAAVDAWVQHKPGRRFPC
jgi:hypothetical protein